VSLPVTIFSRRTSGLIALTSSVHTSKWVVEKCLAGDLVKGRTVVMVVRGSRTSSNPYSLIFTEQTHNVALASTVAQYVVSFGKGGRILSQGSISDALKINPALAEDSAAEQGLADKADGSNSDPKPSQAAGGKLIVAEEMQEGHVSRDACK
jgi:hypothetical protein